MKHRLLLVALTGMSSMLVAQNPAAPAPPTTPPTPVAPAPSGEQPKPKRSIFKYTPPPATAGTGARKDGDGASRGDEEFDYPDTVYTVTPKQGVAYTTQGQPSLFAYLSDQVDYEVRFTITKPDEPKASFILTMSKCAPGIYRVNLADHGLTLPVNVEYRWTITVRPDQENRSKDLDAWSIIKRIEPSADLAKKLKEHPLSDHAAIYAEAGIWYDSFAALRDQLGANPTDADLLAQQKALFDQIQINAAAKKPGAGARGAPLKNKSPSSPSGYERRYPTNQRRRWKSVG